MAKSYRDALTSLRKNSRLDDGTIAEDVLACISASYAAKLKLTDAVKDIAKALVDVYTSICSTNSYLVIRGVLGAYVVPTEKDKQYQNDAKYQEMRAKYSKIINYGPETLSGLREYLQKQSIYTLKALSKLDFDQKRMFVLDAEAVMHVAIMWKYLGAGYLDTDDLEIRRLGWLRSHDEYELYWKGRTLQHNWGFQKHDMIEYLLRRQGLWKI